MLTIDDINSIVEKYGDVGYWLSVPVSELPINEGDYIQVDILKITKLSANIKWRIYCDNAMFGGIGCFTKNGKLSSSDSTIYPRSNYEYDISLYNDVDTIHFYLSWNSIIQGIEVRNGMLIFPISDLTVPIFNGNFDDRFYINPNGNTRITLDGVQVPLQTDEKGSYILLPSAKRWVLGTNQLSLYTITFKEFKTLPIPYIPTLYKGTPQSIQVFNSEDDTPISDYQCQYQGRILKDNTIQLPYDSDEYVDIVVDLKDYRYPFCRVKLKAPTTLYTANSQSDVETAIENGIQTLQVGDTQTEVTLNSIELSNVTLINSNIQVSESILNDCQIIDTSYTDNGDNTLSDSTWKTSTITSTDNPSTYADCKIMECEIDSMELHLTGAITDSTLTNTLIISDGIIEVINNTFTGKNSKDYFPSFLYLTGDYLAKNNTFTLNDEWTEPAFNMCIIKSIDSFNPSLFIAENTFNLNIEYSTEEPNTFYYNIVDDDKIKAKRLS